MAEILHVLYEHACGYTLFHVAEFEEMSMLLPQVEAAVHDLGKFNAIVKFVAFSPFKSGTNALDNINSLSEGILHENLRVFIESNVPMSKKKVKSLLGVGDSKLGSAISEENSLNISCVHTGAIPEIIRGIRVHFHKMVQGMTSVTQNKAQLGLGHAYSRAKVKFNINRVDNMIIQSIALLDQLDKDINAFSMRIREWYSYHFPELYKIVPEQALYAKLVKIIKSRKTITEETIDVMEEILNDRSKAQSVYEASKSSMGMDISVIDLLNIEMFAKRVVDLIEYRANLVEYLQKKMSQVAPNLTALIGETVGARLISHAGSLTNLAKCPASTLQILGAEKALFRALKVRGNTPKYGLIFHSTFIGRAGAQNKGRISRFLANKCSLATRVDCFADFPNSVIGVHLRQQVEDRLLYFETGSTPKKNIDIMRLALAEVANLYVKHQKKEKKKKKKSLSIVELPDNAMVNGDTVVGVPVDESGGGDKLVSSKKKRKLADEEEAEADVTEKSKKKKKKKHDESVVEEVETVNGGGDEVETPSKKKKKKKKSGDEEEEVEKEEVVVVNTETPSSKKKKKKKKAEDEEEAEVVNTETPVLKKKKKKKKSGDDDEAEEEQVVNTQSSSKKKKKKKLGAEGEDGESTTPLKGKKKKESDDVDVTENTETPSKKKSKKKKSSKVKDEED
ncbi:nucleolar protein 56 [Octopus sinensis]|uniref:Nucleolar protein 56 n=1 Tax=Octopus sinensis TaxID=2607531 RepID=A0A6P7T5H4_9MOLL|nr:nucleolar protein 56 [Octopus sinensis]